MSDPISGSQINPDTGKAYAINPSTGSWDDNYYQTVALPQAKLKLGITPAVEAAQKQAEAAQEALKPENVIANAQKLNSYYQEQNKPIVENLQGQQAPLEQRYKDLVANIKGQQGVATDRQTLTTNNELGKRGLDSRSGVYQQDMTNALNPIGVQYGGLLNQADTSHAGDAAALANAIATAQAGNPDAAYQGASTLAGIQNSSSQFQQNLAQQAAQDLVNNQYNQQQFAFQQDQANKVGQTSLKDQYATLGEGQTLYNLLNGGAVYTAPKTYKDTGSGSGAATNYYGGGW